VYIRGSVHWQCCYLEEMFSVKVGTNADSHNDKGSCSMRITGQLRDSSLGSGLVITLAALKELKAI
jgi:hypothetical protein